MFSHVPSYSLWGMLHFQRSLIITWAFSLAFTDIAFSISLFLKGIRWLQQICQSV